MKPTLVRFCATFVFCTLLCNCAAKKPVVRESIPPRCIVGGFADRTKCVPYEKDPALAVCDQVLVKYACVEVEK